MLSLLYFVIALSSTASMHGMQKALDQKNMQFALAILQSQTRQDKQIVLEKKATMLNNLLRQKQISAKVKAEIVEKQEQQRSFWQTEITIPESIHEKNRHTKIVFSNLNNALIAINLENHAKAEFNAEAVDISTIDNNQKKHQILKTLVPTNKYDTFITLRKANSLVVFDIATCKEICTKVHFGNHQTKHEDSIEGLISHHGQLLSLFQKLSDTCKIMLSNLDSVNKNLWKITPGIPGYSAVETPIIFSNDDKLFAYISHSDSTNTSNDSIVNLHETATGLHYWHAVLPDNFRYWRVHPIAFTPNAKNLVVTSFDATNESSMFKILIIDIQNPEKIRTLLPFDFDLKPQPNIINVAHNNKLLFAGNDKGIRIFDINNGALIKLFKPNKTEYEFPDLFYPWAFAQNSIGTQIALLTKNNKLEIRKIIDVLLPYLFADRLWDLKQKRPIQNHTDVDFELADSHLQ